MFTSNQQIVVDFWQGNTYGPRDMEVGVVGMGYKKKAKLCKQTFINKMYITEYLKKNMINLKNTPHAQVQPPSMTIKNY
jgi:hypothetical protein